MSGSVTTVDSAVRARFRRALATFAAALTVAALAWPGMAAAAPQASLAVSGLETSPGKVRFLLTAGDLPSGTTVDPTKVSVRVADATLPSDAEKVTRADSKLPPRGLMVVLDVSGSVVGARLAAAQAAVNELAAALPDDVSAGLIAVSDKPTLLLSPTPDRAALTKAANRLSAKGETALYDGVSLADDTLRAANFGPTTERRVLVLSDGLDTASQLTRAALINRLTADKLPVDVVAFQAGKAGLDALQELAQPGGGRVLTAPDAAFVTQAFRAVASSFSVVLEVEADVPTQLGEQKATLTVSFDTGAGVLTTTVPVTFAKSPAVPVADAPSFGWIPSWALWAVGGLLFVGLITLVVTLAWPGSRKQARIRQIDQFGPVRAIRALNPEQASAVARAALSVSRAVVRSGGLDARIALSLERAGMRLRPPEWLLLRASLVIPGAAVLFLLFGWVGIPIGGLAGWFGTGVYRSVRASRRATAFDDQLPDALQLVIGSLRAGFSLPQAIDALVRESPEPISSEFGRALSENRLGADLSDALEGVAQRTMSDDLATAVMAVRIQREVGGNLAEVLQTTVDTIRERGRLRRHVRSLSAEGRLSAWVLIALPLLLAAYFFTFRRDYLRPLYTEPIGIAMLLGGAGLLVVGIIWMTRTVKVEI
jgi:Flp pilus assembly protein TadB/Mg-chelatase subunit ChlD